MSISTIAPQINNLTLVDKPPEPQTHLTHSREQTTGEPPGYCLGSYHTHRISALRVIKAKNCPKVRVNYGIKCRSF